jgi:hypothetical protein
MTSRRILEYAIAALAGATAVFVKEILSTTYFLVVILIPSLAAIITFVVLHQFVGELLKQYNFIRKFFLPLAKMEGRWINYSTRRGGNKFGVIELYYDTDKEAHCISGISYGESGLLEAEWFSQPILFDRAKIKLEYRFSGERQIEVESEEVSDTSTKNFENIEGWTTISFDRQNPDIGHGYFINFNPIPIRREFTVARLTEDIQVNLLGKFPNDSEIVRRLSSATPKTALCTEGKSRSEEKAR